MDVLRIESQIHGYREGHQMLSASASLSKHDQLLIDRLSDMAGPLRPGEMFEPYLSGYPLPSRDYYVLARTVQDLEVSRAGCVRTWSLLIPRTVWSSATGIKVFVDLLDPGLFPLEAHEVVISDQEISPLPPVEDLGATDLVEAVFLEEGAPVAAFGVSEPELVVVRLLTSLWPGVRARFSVSTFALSPRKIQGQNFDLVFSPRDARPKFSNWSGRRVDWRVERKARHPWTSRIVERVFNAPFPRLLEEGKHDLIESEQRGGTGALRIALMWEDLLRQVERSPSAALGLLDIASSGMVDSVEAYRTVEPLLARAAKRAVSDLPVSDAWDFLGAMVRKLDRNPLNGGMDAVGEASVELAGRDPSGAVLLLDRKNTNGDVDTILRWIAMGLARSFDNAAERALLRGSPDTLARLICAESPLAERIVNTPLLGQRLSDVLPILSSTLFDDVKRVILPLLLEDAQLEIVRVVLATLDESDLLEMVQKLSDTNDFRATTFMDPIVDRARELGAIEPLRDCLVSVPVSESRDLFIYSTIAPSVEDFIWLLEGEELEGQTVESFVANILRGADDEQFEILLSDDRIGASVLSRLSLEASDVLNRAIVEVDLCLPVYLSTTLRLLLVIEGERRVELALKALERCLARKFDGDEVNTICMLLGAVGSGLDGEWVVRCGLRRRVSASICNRNLLAFDRAPDTARKRILTSIDELARILERRYNVDLDAHGATACAHLMLDASIIHPDAVLKASGRILPMLLRSTRKPVSILVAATFPFVYLELAKEDVRPSLLGIMLFVDWDRCKTARRKLVGAFLDSSVWAPGDLALTACRCLDVDRILKRTAKSFGGDAYLERMELDLERLPEDCEKLTVETMKTIKDQSSSRYSWRD